MAKGVNKVILVGNCGQDPEVRYSQSGTAFASLSIATTEKWKDKQTGNDMEHTEWHRLVFAARLAEVVGEYVTKGMTIYVEGKLATRKWTDQSGVEKYTTEVKCFEMQMLGSKTEGGQQNQPAQQGGYGQQPAQRPAPQQRQQPQATQPPPNIDSFDDDIPF